MSAATSQPRILIVDADGQEAQRMGLALDQAGFEVGWCSFAPSELSTTLKDLRPTLLLVHAELASPQVATLLARLESAAMPAMPVVLLCKDLSDEGFLRTLRTGVVEMLAEPFSPRPHVGRVRTLITELAARPGTVRGRGAPNELSAFLQHLMRTRRTGGLTVGEAGEGSAFFVRGVLKSARAHASTMQTALAAMTRGQAPWTFTEGLEGTAGVVDFDAAEDEPLVLTGPAATFTQDAPRAPAPAAPERPAPPRPPAPAPAAADPEAAHTRLLFVDDDPAVVHMLASFFSKKGYQVVTAADGLEAMTALVAQPFEAVIADLNMPRLDGWGLLRLVREDFRTHEVPVALFSAQDNYRESLRLLHAGAQAYFPKTLRLSSLEAQVRELLEPRRRFVRLVSSEGGMSFDFGALGAQWACRALAKARFTGQLDARDAWASWRLWFADGRLAQASARIGSSTLAGDRALASFLCSRDAEGSLQAGTRALDEGFSNQPTTATLGRVVPWVNDEQRRAREDQLAKATALTVNDDLYRLYVTVGPPAWLPIAQLLCEAKLAPADVIARLRVTPAEVAAVVKDLLRRQVAGLQ